MAGSARRRGRTNGPSTSTAYAATLARHLGPLGVTVACEPGDQLAKDAAILLGEVVTVEERRGVTFVGLDIGWNVNCAYFIYRFAQEIVLCRAADADRTETVTVAGHINEAATSSPRTTRCHRSGRATSSRCSTRAATTRP